MNRDLFSAFYLSGKEESLVCSEAIEAYCYYPNKKKCLLSGEVSPSSFENIQNELSRLSLNQNYNDPIVLHLFYELGFYFNETKSSLEEDYPLAIMIKYKKASLESKSDEKVKLEIKTERKVDKIKYHSRFNKVMNHLLDGNCYQVNLTDRFLYNFKTEGMLSKLYQNLWKQNGVGEFAHCTYSQVLQRYFLSNTPECLFEIQNEKIITKPIKGTVNLKDFGNEEEAWSFLDSDKKNESELNMITDLMRNDLTRISLNPAKVLTKKAKLKVPKILHQHSIVEAKLDKKTNLLDVVSKLFPGGSITGAPKKRVMDIIESLEDLPRGFYCGSTILLYKDIKKASINIRSCDFDLNSSVALYGSGGGITLNSEVSAEYEELNLKNESFLSFLRSTK